MAFTHWKDAYSTGIEAIDQQHKMILERLQFLRLAVSSGEGKEVVGQLLLDMLEYAREHFAFEEKLFTEYGYPGAESHSAEHKSFTGTVQGRYEEYIAGADIDPMEILEFLGEWVGYHVLHVDAEYLPFFREVGLIK